MQLPPATERFVLHWGEMGNKWGVNRTVAQIHALLFLSERPLNADELVETLGIARSNVSNSIRELQSLKLVQTTHVLGDRRDYFTTSHDVWQLARTIVEQRYQRELAPTVNFLQELIQSPEFQQENPEVQTRIRDTHEFVSQVSGWASDMLKLPTSALTKLLKLGSTIQRWLK